MGIRGSRRHDDGLFLGRRIGKGTPICNGCGSRWASKTSPVGSFSAKCVRSLRHGRQRLAMGAGLLSRGLQWSAHRRFGVDQRRLQSPCRPRRFLEAEFLWVLRSAYRVSGTAAVDRVNAAGFRVARTLLAP